MFDWLKQKLGNPGSANHEAVPEAIINAIVRDLARIRNADEGVHAAVLKYILEGVGDAPAVLRPRSRTSLVFSSARQSDADQRKVRWEIYDAWDRLPPLVLIRFGNVLSASSNALAQSRLILAQKHPWIEA